MVAKGDLIASLFLAVFTTGLLGILYNINPESGWPILTTIGLLSFLVMAYILQNQRKNQRKWEKRPITFPNPEGETVQEEEAQVSRKGGANQLKIAPCCH